MNKVVEFYIVPIFPPEILHPYSTWGILILLLIIVEYHHNLHLDNVYQGLSFGKFHELFSV